MLVLCGTFEMFGHFRLLLHSKQVWHHVGSHNGQSKIWVQLASTTRGYIIKNNNVSDHESKRSLKTLKTPCSRTQETWSHWTGELLPLWQWWWETISFRCVSPQCQQRSAPFGSRATRYCEGQRQIIHHKKSTNSFENQIQQHAVESTQTMTKFWYILVFSVQLLKLKTAYLNREIWFLQVHFGSCQLIL